MQRQRQPVTPPLRSDLPAVLPPIAHRDQDVVGQATRDLPPQQQALDPPQDRADLPRRIGRFDQAHGGIRRDLRRARAQQLFRQMLQCGRAIIIVFGQIFRLHHHTSSGVSRRQGIERLLEALADGRLALRHGRQRDHGVAHLFAQQRQQLRLQ